MVGKGEERIGDEGDGGGGSCRGREEGREGILYSKQGEGLKGRGRGWLDGVSERKGDESSVTPHSRLEWDIKEMQISPKVSRC